MNQYTIINGELYHYGVKGMKWGVRRYTNEDGSLTTRGQMKKLKMEDRLAKTKYKQSIADSKVMTARKQNRVALSSKYDNKINKAMSKNKIDKANALSEQKKAHLSNFDAGTSALKKAQKIGNENRNRINELKIKSISDPSIKNSPSYKQAKQWAASQLVSELAYGKSATLLMEANSVIVNKGESWTRGKNWKKQ